MTMQCQIEIASDEFKRGDAATRCPAYFWKSDTIASDIVQLIHVQVTLDTSGAGAIFITEYNLFSYDSYGTVMHGGSSTL
jgi:hypothetical protein